MRALWAGIGSAWFRGCEGEGQEQLVPGPGTGSPVRMCAVGMEGDRENGLVKLGGAPPEAAGDPRRAADSPLPLYASFFVRS